MTALSAATVGRIGARTNCKMFLHTAGDTSANILTDGTKKYAVNSRDIAGLRVAIMEVVATSGCTKLEIVACSDASGTNATSVKELTVSLTALQKWASLEVTADELNLAEVSAGKVLPYVTVRLTCGSSADKVAVFFLMDPVRFGGVPGTDTWVGGLPVYNTDYGV